MSTPPPSTSTDSPMTEAVTAAVATVSTSETTATKRTADDAVAGETSTSAPTINAEEGNTAIGESAAKKHRPQIEKEDTSAYMGTKRSKVRGNIRGADKYKGKRNDGWGSQSRNAQDAAAAVAKAAAGETGADADAGEGESKDENKEARIPKRKIALLMGYCGTGYQGMQVNPNAKTIEGDLFKAMIEAGAVSKDNADDIKKVSMMRSARTDKGVHAAGNVVSLKMIVEDPEIITKINAKLPEQIRLFGYVRTNNSFNAKVLCDSRVYEYLLPTYVFLPRPEFPEKPEGEALKPTVVREDAPDGSMAWDENVKISTPEEMVEKRKYRIDEATLAKVREAFKAYEGTQNFHNFTIGKKFNDRACKRYIMSFNVSDPKMIQGTEWLSLKVHGQSFMLHQIRKMVGLVVMMIRTETPINLIPETFKANQINIPKAPSLGLLLERPQFATYNRKVAATHAPLEFEPYAEEMDAFREKFIYDGIIREELEFNRFDEYLQILDGHADRYNFKYLNKEGTIPEDAIIVRGQGSAQPTESDAESDASS
ncbi:tRNA pseudouridine synthase 1 [Gryganskiella cystojenkinii]|nr:tRNA pseudouridine synthase 1 [Gryganskiella cystojenkinii]